MLPLDAPVTPAELEQIEARLAGIQPYRPEHWRLRPYDWGGRWIEYPRGTDPDDATERFDLFDLDDREFVEWMFHAPQDIATLLAALRESREREARLREHCLPHEHEIWCLEAALQHILTRTDVEEIHRTARRALDPRGEMAREALGEKGNTDA